MIRKIVLALIAVAFMATPALADNRPEFDAVGCDALNVFNGLAEELVIDNSTDRKGDSVQAHSVFLDLYDESIEYFSATGGPSNLDPCFEVLDLKTGELYESVFTPRYTGSTYTWKIVLQMQPESDIDLDIRDCVLKPQGAQQGDIFTQAEQTGRFFLLGPDPNNILKNGKGWYFIPTANPRVTVKAYPGPYANPYWKYGAARAEDGDEHFSAKPFYMNARTMPGLVETKLKDQLYTSKALWEEGLVMVMPEDGDRDGESNTMYQLRTGDEIKVTIQIPMNSTTDINYGSDNVMLRYIGVVGTEYLGEDDCSCLDCGS